MIWEDMKSWYCENNYNLRKQLYPLAVSQRAPSKIFGKVVSMPPVLNIQRFWIAHGPECARVLDIPGFWKCLWFWICLDSEYTRALNMSGYTVFRMCLNNNGICRNMPDYVWTYLNMRELAGICMNKPKSAWMIFVLISPSLSLGKYASIYANID